ncbi:MAG: alginate lyase family protein [Rickettsiales bacterium]|nr:alginate lyase family protein [Rickettsiales bacterium]
MFVDEKNKQNIYYSINKNADIIYELRDVGDSCLKQNFVSVTEFKKPNGVNLHEYCSFGYYWHPDPTKPNGLPYIKKDGIINVEANKGCKVALKNMAESVFHLAVAGHYLQNKIYTDYAINLLYTWFVDKDTYMNPNLKFAQIIPGIDMIRGIGIIDGLPFITICHALEYINNPIIDDMKKWFSEYLHWLNSSEYGRMLTKNNKNNHISYYNAQLMCYAIFTDNEKIIQECVERYKIILQTQTNDECAFTAELTRTRSLHYCLFMLESLVITCELAFQRGIDLWKYTTNCGKNIEKCIDFMFPYIKKPFRWPFPQIIDEYIAPQSGLQLGAIRLGRDDYRILDEKMRDEMKTIYPFLHIDELKVPCMGELCFLEGYF